MKRYDNYSMAPTSMVEGENGRYVKYSEAKEEIDELIKQKTIMRNIINLKDAKIDKLRGQNKELLEDLNNILGNYGCVHNENDLVNLIKKVEIDD